MKKLFSIKEKKPLSQVNKLEDDLQQFICDNWNELFPQYKFIKKEFPLDEIVHDTNSKGRIDILAYNPATKKFVIFELKKDSDKYVVFQAKNYWHYLLYHNFLAVYVDAREKYGAEFLNKNEINSKEAEIIIIAKEFNHIQISHARTENITLIEYGWFENDLVLLDYVHDSTPKPKPPKIIDGTKKIDDPGKIWGSIERLIKKREDQVKEYPTNTEKEKEKKKKLEEFIHITKECIATRNAQLLYDSAKSPSRPRFRDYAKRILKLEQNVPETKIEASSNTNDG